MRWLPSSKTRYFVLGLALLALLAILDSLARALIGFGGPGFAVTLWACFATVYAWLLLEPLVSSLMLLSNVRDPLVLDRLDAMAKHVAAQGKMGTVPRLQVYQDAAFGVMTVGLGKAATIFMSSSVASMDESELRAIIAHECGHIKLGHAVVRLCVFGSLLALAIVINGMPVIAMVANLFVLWTMRQMEFQADRSAAQIVGREAVAAALSSARTVLGEVAAWQTLFSTHPRFSARIERLARC